MARLFGLISALALSGAQADMSYTNDCNSAWGEAKVHGCFDSNYNKSVVCDGRDCKSSFEGVLGLCNGTDRGHHAQILVEYCEDPSSKNCSEAHDIFDFVDCKEGFTVMCSDRCEPYMEVMSMKCSSEMITNDDGTMSNLKEVSTMMLDSCSDECAMHFAMFSDCMHFGDDTDMTCRPECNGHAAALEAEPCFSQTMPGVPGTYGEFIAQGQAVYCHPCYMLYEEAIYGYDCDLEHGDCSTCTNLMDQMWANPRCTGDETLGPDGPLLSDIVASLGSSVDYYCDHSAPQRKCHKISQQLFKKVGAVGCDAGY